MALAPRKRTWGDLGVRERHRSLLTESERERADSQISEFADSVSLLVQESKKLSIVILSVFFWGGGGHSPEI